MHDVVVVGAGGSGAVVAARLSEQTDVSVLLVEAGEAVSVWEDLGALLDGDSLVSSVDPRTSWSYAAELLPGRDWKMARGRGLGGSTAVNAGYFVRALPSDIAGWRAAGGSAWSAGHVLEAYRRSERDLDVLSGAVSDERGTHGLTGPVRVRRASCDDPVSRAFAEASLAVGAVWRPDLNSDGSAGVGPVPRDVVDGVRWGTGAAYLLPAMGRRNLDVRGGVHALRVRFRRATSGRLRAVGVELLTESGFESVDAGRVVLSAGAIGSAQLLLASGVGPARELERVGIKTLVGTPVGESTSDHPQISLGWRPPRLPEPGTALLGPALQLGDLELMPLLRPTAELLGADAGRDPALDILIADQRPQSRGSLRPRCADPLAAPILQSGYLATERDRRAMRDGVRLALDLVASGMGVAEDSAVSHLDDNRLDVWIRSRLGTALHLSGTAPMGIADAPGAVVDGTGRVHGVEGLQVIDLSVLPRVPSRGPAATAVMLGELLAPSVLL